MGYAVLLFVYLPQVKSGVEMPWDEQGVWRTDLYVSSGVLGLGIFSLLAITSLPSVGNILTWREFTFIQVGNANPCMQIAQVKQRKRFQRPQVIIPSVLIQIHRVQLEHRTFF